MMIRAGDGEIVKTVHAVGPNLVLFPQMRSTICSLDIFLDHVEWAVTLIAWVALVERAGTAAMAVIYSRALAAGGRGDLSGCLFYALADRSVGTIEAWECFGSLGETVFSGAGVLLGCRASV